MHNLNTEYGSKIKHLRLSYFRSQKLGEELRAQYFLMAVNESITTRKMSNTRMLGTTLQMDMVVVTLSKHNTYCQRFQHSFHSLITEKALQPIL